MKEAIGRNYHTADTDPYTWKDNPDIEVETYANDDGGWSALVRCLGDKSLSTELRTFPDEFSASHWARQQADRIVRTRINEVVSLKKLIRQILQEIYSS